METSDQFYRSSGLQTRSLARQPAASMRRPVKARQRSQWAALEAPTDSRRAPAELIRGSDNNEPAYEHFPG
ncbi:MAG: hypothetical protein PsegKO_13320 [Pseudohongiellaceae bacterium]